MSQEQETKIRVAEDAGMWEVVKVLEEDGRKVEVISVVDPNSNDELSKFVLATIDTLEERAKHLKTPIIFKSHGRRRGMKERKNIVSSRLKEAGQIDSLLKVLKGEDKKPIEFVETGGNIVGFKIEEIPPNGR